LILPRRIDSNCHHDTSNVIKSTRSPDATARQSRRLPWLKYLGLAFLVWLTFSTYRTVERNRAASELRTMGFEAGTESIPSVIRRHGWGSFKAIFNKKRLEWDGRVRLLGGQVSDLNQAAPALQRFKPREVLLGFCRNLDDVSVLRKFPKLERLDFYECPHVTDLGIVSEFTNLKELTFRNSPALRDLGIIQSGTQLVSLHISNCDALVDLQALKQLTSLRSLHLSDCAGVKDAESIRGLSALEDLDLSGCAQLTDVKGLQGLKSLKTVNLRNCRNLPVDAVTALRAALPNTKIQHP
jgi:hypothetical protein